MTDAPGNGSPGGAAVYGRPPGRAFWTLLATETRLALRTPIGVIYGLAFPLVLFIIFASIPSFRKPNSDLGGLTYLSIMCPSSWSSLWPCWP